MRTRGGPSQGHDRDLASGGAPLSSVLWSESNAGFLCFNSPSQMVHDPSPIWSRADQTMRPLLASHPTYLDPIRSSRWVPAPYVMTVRKPRAVLWTGEEERVPPSSPQPGAGGSGEGGSSWASWASWGPPSSRDGAADEGSRWAWPACVPLWVLFSWRRICDQPSIPSTVEEEEGRRGERGGGGRHCPLLISFPPRYDGVFGRTSRKYMPYLRGSSSVAAESWPSTVRVWAPTSLAGTGEDGTSSNRQVQKRGIPQTGSDPLVLVQLAVGRSASLARTRRTLGGRRRGESRRIPCAWTI